MPEEDCATYYPGVTAHSTVALDLLDELRTARYSPSAWIRFVAHAWSAARQTAHTHPQLVRSWRRVAAGLVLAEAVALSAEARAGGQNGLAAAQRAAPGAALCLAYTLGDTYVHLGMNHEACGEPLRDILGLPSTLTLARSATAGILFGHLLGRAPANKAVMSLALAVAGVTDIADGQIARRTGRVTRLGAYLDSEADFGAALALTLTLLSRGDLPRWLSAVLLARWLTPFTYALFVYFGLARRVPISSTVVGKAAGVAQAVTLGVALLPEEARVRAPRLRGALHALMAGLLIAAPLAQFAQAVYATRREEARQRDQR